MLGRLKFDLTELANEMLDNIPEEYFSSSTTTFLDPAMGGAQFVKAVVDRLRKYGHTDENITGRVYGYETNKMRVNFAVNKYKLVGTYTNKEFMEDEVNMKFDVIVGNPPFNSNKKSKDNAKGDGGTGGNSRLYKHFRSKSLTLLKENGYLCFVSLKNIIKDLYKDSNQVEVINLMTEKDYWDGKKFNTLYFIERAFNKTSEADVQGGISAKLFGVSEWQYNEFNRTEDRIGSGTTTAIINLPKVSNNFTVETANVKTALPAKPRFAFTLLESNKSYTVSDLPFCGSMCGCVTLDTMEEAEALKKFISNNKALKHFFRTMKLKGYAKDILRYTKKIDLSQIKTGSEYPKEWNLTQEEIEYIEEHY